MDQFNRSLIADPPLKNPYFGLPDIANILTPRDEVARIRSSKKAPNTLIGLYGQADRMTDQETTEFIIQVIQHGNQYKQGFTPDWKAVAAGLGVANGHHVKRRFEVILKAHGFSINREGVISGRGNIVAGAEAEADSIAIADAAAASTTTESYTAATSFPADDTEDDAFVSSQVNNPNIDPELLSLQSSMTIPSSSGTPTATLSSSPYIGRSLKRTQNKPAPFSASSGFAGLARGQGTPTPHLAVSPATAAAMTARGLTPPSKRPPVPRKKRDSSNLAETDQDAAAVPVKKKRGRKPRGETGNTGPSVSEDLLLDGDGFLFDDGAEFDG